MGVNGLGGFDLHLSSRGDLGATGCRGVPTVKGVPRARGRGERAVGSVVGDLDTGLRCYTAVGIQQHGIFLSHPVSVQHMGLRFVHDRALQHLLTAALCGEPTHEGISRTGGCGQSAVCRAKGHRFIGDGNAATASIELNAFGQRSPLGVHRMILLGLHDGRGCDLLIVFR